MLKHASLYSPVAILPGGREEATESSSREGLSSYGFEACREEAWSAYAGFSAFHSDCCGSGHHPHLPEARVVRIKFSKASRVHRNCSPQQMML